MEYRPKNEGPTESVPLTLWKVCRSVRTTSTCTSTRECFSASGAMFMPIFEWTHAPGACVSELQPWPRRHAREQTPNCGGDGGPRASPRAWGHPERLEAASDQRKSYLIPASRGSKIPVIRLFPRAEEGIRTPDLPLTRRLLWPTELLRQNYLHAGTFYESLQYRNTIAASPQRVPQCFSQDSSSIKDRRKLMKIGVIDKVRIHSKRDLRIGMTGLSADHNNRQALAKPRRYLRTPFRR